MKSKTPRVGDVVVITSGHSTTGFPPSRAGTLGLIENVIYLVPDKYIVRTEDHWTIECMSWELEVIDHIDDPIDLDAHVGDVVVIVKGNYSPSAQPGDLGLVLEQDNINYFKVMLSETRSIWLNCRAFEVIDHIEPDRVLLVDEMEKGIRSEKLRPTDDSVIKRLFSGGMRAGKSWSHDLGWKWPDLPFPHFQDECGRSDLETYEAALKLTTERFVADVRKALTKETLRIVNSLLTQLNDTIERIQ